MPLRPQPKKQSASSPNLPYPFSTTGTSTGASNSGGNSGVFGIPTPKPKLEDCPHCGKRHDVNKISNGLGHLLRLQIEDDKDDDLYLETCMTELIQFMARNLRTRYTDVNGKPK